MIDRWNPSSSYAHPIFPLLDKFLGAFVMLDVGSGDGYRSLEMAKMVAPQQAIFTDKSDSLEINLPEWIEFRQLDVESQEFIGEFKNRVHFVTSILAIHEFASPLQAALNLFAIVPAGGVVLIVDWAEEGWKMFQSSALLLPGKSAREIEELMLQHAECVEIAKQKSLYTNQGIRVFWENLVFPGIRGECSLRFRKPMYEVLFVKSSPMR